ncbi:hypothetical protein FGAF247_17180 [Escherichia coli]|nr:hypothetical protein FGAF247_17180 [Escherichia coli]
MKIQDILYPISYILYPISYILYPIMFTIEKPDDHYQKHIIFMYHYLLN